MSALLWIFLEVVIEPLLPLSQISILIECPVGLSDCEPRQFGWAHLKAFDGFSESLLILLKQEGLDESPGSLVEELGAVLEEAGQIIE